MKIPSCCGQSEMSFHNIKESWELFRQSLFYYSIVLHEVSIVAVHLTDEDSLCRMLNHGNKLNLTCNKKL
jgi:hypothetical protein